MSPLSFRIACLTRLGLPIPGLDNYCSSSQLLDKCGYHLWSCSKHTSLVLQRHKMIVKMLVELATSAGISTRTKGITDFMRSLPEVVSQPPEETTATQCQTGTPNSRGGRGAYKVDMQRTDILFSGMGSNGERLYLDVAGVSATCQSYVGFASINPGHAIGVIEGKKRDKYNGKCIRIGASFLPFIFETHGRVSEKAISFIRMLVLELLIHHIFLSLCYSHIG